MACFSTWMEQETFFFSFLKSTFHYVCLLPITPGGCYERHGNFAMRYFREKTKKCFTEQETIMSVKEMSMQQIWFWHVIQVYFYSMAGDFFLFKIILCRCSQLMQKYYWNIPVICLCPSCAILHTLYMSSFPNGITHLETLKA